MGIMLSSRGPVDEESRTLPGSFQSERESERASPAIPASPSLCPLSSGRLSSQRMTTQESDGGGSVPQGVSSEGTPAQESEQGLARGAATQPLINEGVPNDTTNRRDQKVNEERNRNLDRRQLVPRSYASATNPKNRPDRQGSISRPSTSIPRNIDQVWSRLDVPSRQILRQHFDGTKERRVQEVQGPLLSEIQMLRLQVEQEYARYQNTEYHLHHQINQLQTMIQQEQNRAKAIQEQYQELAERHQEASKLAEARGLELQAAQTFLSKADGCSTSELVKMAKALNEEIFQAASFIAEALISEEDHAGLFKKYDRRRVDDKTTWSLVVKVQKSKERSLLVEQWIFQHALAVAAVTVIHSWGEKSDTEFVGGVIEAMAEHEPDSVCGKWRALAHTYSPGLINGEMDQQRIIKHFEKRIMLAMRDIGYEHFSLNDLDGNVRRTLADQLQGIAKQTTLLRNAVHRSMITGTVHAFYLEPGLRYNPENMGNACEEVQVVANDVLVSTAALGLSMMLAGVQSWLLKPQVIVEKVLDEL